MKVQSRKLLYTRSNISSTNILLCDKWEELEHSEIVYYYRLGVQTKVKGNFKMLICS